MNALFRARFRALLRKSSGHTRAALELLPALFHATFPSPLLRGDAPGVETARVCLRWMKRAIELGLPPPTGLERGRCLVAALLATPSSGGVEIHVVPVAGLGPVDEQRITVRARAVEALFQRHQLSMFVTVTGSSAQPFDAASRSRLLSFGGLVVGQLPKGFPAPGSNSDGMVSQPWKSATDAVARSLSLLSLEAWPSGEAAEVEDIVEWAQKLGQPLLRCADQGLYAAIRVALRSRKPSLGFLAVALATDSAALRSSAWALAQRFDPRLTSRFRLEPRLVLQCGRELACELKKALRRMSAAHRRALEPVLDNETLAGDFPRIFLDVLRQATGFEPGRAGTPGVRLVRSKAAMEVVFDAGGVLGRGATQAQAWVRGLLLLGHLAGRPVVPVEAGDVWRKIVPRLLEPTPRRCVVLELEPKAVPGPPYDPLNRGPHRRIALDQGLLVCLRPSRRPSARSVSGVALAKVLLKEAAIGTSLDFLPAGTEVQSLEARITRLSRRVHATVPHLPLAAEVGGTIFVVRKESVTAYDRRAFGRRPVSCEFDPEAPDFGAPATQGRGVTKGKHLLQCLVWRNEDSGAELLIADQEGYLLRETVPLDWAEHHLEEALRLLRVGPHAVLCVRADDAAVQTSSPAIQGAPVISLALRGSLPFGLTLQVGQEHFGAGHSLGWSAAAMLLLSRWPLGVQGGIRFESVDVTLRGQPVGGLLKLYARSVALRRLFAHMQALSPTSRKPKDVPNSSPEAAPMSASPQEKNKHVTVNSDERGLTQRPA